MLQADAHKDSLGEELAFWRNKLRERGTPSAERLKIRLEVHPIPDFIARALEGNPATPLRILDVGSGPLTTLGTTLEGRLVEVHPLDPLADAYNGLLDELDMVVPVRPIQGMGEELTSLYPASFFDFAHACNSLDHCADPRLAISQMLAVLKPGGTMYLYHHENVGELEGYQGLHQWNLIQDGDDLAIWSRWERTRLSDLAPDAEITMTTRDRMVTVVLRKPPKPRA
jgi:SAM-dependent methyltransferase